MTLVRIALFLITTSVLFLNIAWGQKSTYTITAAGKEIGHISTVLVKSGNTETYKVVSEVNFKVLWNHYNRKTDNLAIFENGILQKSHSGIYMDHELEDSASMVLNNNKYSCFRYPDKTTIFSDSLLQFTSVKLYYTEPIGYEKIYSERFLDYCRVEKLGNHKYKIFLPNGKQNIYTYVDGILTEVFVDRTWFNLRFQRKE
ncbi:MAG TPA: hypothetical protein PKL31_02255 [Fulvivirga sp.]|nr:hypothetical protein [Fulvivirga sp.]